MNEHDSPAVAIVRTGVANIASVTAAFERLGVRWTFVEDAEGAHAASHLVCPGVGAFGAGMAALDAAGLVPTLGERVLAGRPTLLICLGLQLLCASSEESAGVAGMGVVPAHVRRFDGPVRVPQFGWNRVQVDPGARFLEPGHAYFANSYYLGEAPEGWTAARAQHGRPFIAAMEREGVLACQFHPELSGAWGMALLQRWMDRAPHRPPLA